MGSDVQVFCSSTCVDLTGHYVLPLGKHDRTGDPPLLMIDQDHCRLISLVVGYGGFIPIGQRSSLDGSEGFSIVGNTIIEKGSLNIPTAGHGHCSAQQIIMALDRDMNMIFTSPKVSGCEDKYKDPLHDTFPRVGWVKPADGSPALTVKAASALTEIERVQRVYAYLNNIKNPNHVPLDAVVLSYDASMMFPPWYMQAFISLSNEHETLESLELGLRML